MTDREKKETTLKELLKERVRIDELVRDKFSKELTIMFTDIEGSTSYFETRGDINGLSMVFTHHQLLLPIIEGHRGSLIKTMGDAIMASFPDAVGAVGAAIKIQQELAAYNARCLPRERIQVRIGVHSGRGIVEENDVFGDLVNVAARITSLAGTGQIMVSHSVYDVVRYVDDITCRYIDSFQLKGKEKGMELYQVLWGGEKGVRHFGDKASRIDGLLKQETPDVFSERDGMSGDEIPGNRRWGLRRMFLVILGVLAVGSFIFGTIIWDGNKVREGTYQLAYQRLKEGRVEEALDYFNQLGASDGCRLEGLAAAYFSTGDYEQAMAMCDQAQVLNPGRLYSHVIKGNIFWDEGKIDEAMGEYSSATQLPEGTPWQRAEAYNRLGRLYAFRHQPEGALRLYTRAYLYDPGSSEVCINQGILYERVGNLGEALSWYRRALACNPEDPVVKVLFEEATRKQRLAGDKDQLMRIDNLVAEVITRYQERKGKVDSSSFDEWTSKPFTLALMNFEIKGIPSLRDGENEYCMLHLISCLEKEAGVQVVERILLDKILEELRLTASPLTDPDLTLQVGKMVAARFIATGLLTRYRAGLQVSVRLIETETTVHRASAVESVDRDGNVGELIEKVALRVINQLREHYPLKGKIISRRGEELVLNVGAECGMQPGLVMKVVGGEVVAREQGKRIISLGKEIGRITVVSVEPTLSYARAIENGRKMEIGFKVEEIRERSGDRREDYHL